MAAEKQTTESEGKPDPLDPTINVQNMLLAAIKRIDDLNSGESKYVGSEISSLREILKLHMDMQNALRLAEQNRSDDLRNMQLKHAGELTQAESKRIDAIRAVDAAQVTRAAEVAAQQALALAAQVATSADALRQLVASTAATQVATAQATANQQNDRISALERSSYEGLGKGRVVDPMMAEMMMEMKRMANTQANNAGNTQGQSNVWGYIAAGIGIAVGIVALFAAFRPH